MIDKLAACNFQPITAFPLRTFANFAVKRRNEGINRRKLSTRSAALRLMPLLARRDIQRHAGEQHAAGDIAEQHPAPGRIASKESMRLCHLFYRERVTDRSAAKRLRRIGSPEFKASLADQAYADIHHAGIKPDALPGFDFRQGGRYTERRTIGAVR